MATNRVLAVSLAAAALLWLIILITAPIALARRGATPAVAVAYRAAGLVCHQRPERSFAIAGMQLPVCARCVGLYVAGAVGAVAACAAGAGRFRAGTRGVRVALAVASAPTILTIVVEWLGLLYPSNATRAVAAVPLGVTAGWMFVRLLNQGSGDVHEASRY